MATTCLTAVTHKQLNIHVDVTMFAKFALEICVFECTFESRVSHNYMDAKFVGYALMPFWHPLRLDALICAKVGTPEQTEY